MDIHLLPNDYKIEVKRPFRLEPHLVFVLLMDVPCALASHQQEASFKLHLFGIWIISQVVTQLSSLLNEFIYNLICFVLSLSIIIFFHFFVLGWLTQDPLVLIANVILLFIVHHVEQCILLLVEISCFSVIGTGELDVAFGIDDHCEWKPSKLEKSIGLTLFILNPVMLDFIPVFLSKDSLTCI